MTKAIQAGVLAAIMASGMAMAQDAGMTRGMPPVIERGLSRFMTTGAKTAVENWTRGGPMEKTRAEAAAITDLVRLEGLYGRYKDRTLIERIRVSPVSDLYYLEIAMENGPIYVMLHAYEQSQRWQVVRLAVAAAPEEILPPHVLERLSSNR